MKKYPFFPKICGRASKVNCYYSAVQYTQNGDYKRPAYDNRVLNGNLHLHALYLLHWMNFGALTLGLLTQTDFKTKSDLLLGVPHVRHYCLNQMKLTWNSLQSRIQLKTEQLHIFVIKTFLRHLQARIITNNITLLVNFLDYYPTATTGGSYSSF